MRNDGALLALVLMASCDAGTSQKAMNAILPDVAAPEAAGASQAADAAAGASQAADATAGTDEASTDATIAPISEEGANSDSASDAWSPGLPHQDAAPGVGLDATDLDAPGPDPARVHCRADAAEAGVCPLPYSVCADGRWLVFYDNAQCVSGSCAWQKRYLDCGSIGCFVGQCRPPFTQ